MCRPHQWGSLLPEAFAVYILQSAFYIHVGAVPHPPAAGKSGKGEVDVYGVCSEEPERW
jgi:hypothetical protein